MNDTTGPDAVGRPAAIADGPAGSRFWNGVFQLLFASFPDSMTRWTRRRFGMGPVEELVIVGRRSGMPRHVFASVLRTDAAWYAGHPTGDDAQWVRNLAAAGIATVIDRTGAATRVRATRLERGPERDLAIGEALRQNRFPVSPIYRLGRGHIQAVGAYFRLEPLAER